MALADREFINDGSPAWSAEWARRAVAAKGVADQVLPTLAALRRAAEPVPVGWLGDRLSILWTMFMASRSQVDPDALTIWLAEYTRLLADLPHDVVAFAIDRAVQAARHGFMPSVGEVRGIAEPVAAERARQIERLTQIEDEDGGDRPLRAG